MKKKRKFIVLEGGEGSGKTSVINFLKRKFSQRQDIIFTREPGGTETGAKIRKILMDKKNKKITGLTELFLFCADRAQHVSELIIPALKSGKHVISDRFDRSTIAYQIVARGIEDLNVFNQLNSIAKQGVEPDGIIYLDVTPKVGLERKSKSKEGKCTRFDKEDLHFHQRVRKGFNACGQMMNMKRLEDGRYIKIWHRVNTTHKSEDKVKQDVLNLVKKILAE
ncbi:MAG: dTMP kinase [Candidatus Paceibacteria bacterium]